MPVFTIRFPELAHLPLERRQEIVERCTRDPSFTRIRAQFARWGMIFPISAAATTYGITSLVEVRRWPMTLGLIALGIILGSAVLAFVKLWREARQLRRLIRIELTRPDTTG